MRGRGKAKEGGMVGVPSPGDWLLLGLKANVESAGSTPSSSSKAQPVVSFREAQGHGEKCRERESFVKMAQPAVG